MDPSDSSRKLGKIILSLFIILLIGVIGYFIYTLLKPEEAENEEGLSDLLEEETDTDNSDEEDVIDETEESDETPVEEPDTPVNGQADFENFSTEIQTVGDTSANTEYSLESITDTAMQGFHRFEFTLSSEEDMLPDITAQLVSSGGYIKVTLDRVTSDSSGIGYSSSRDINKDGVLKLYHSVTPVSTEEVYQIGVTADAEFYLHEDGLKAILDVKYPGNAAAEEPGTVVEDPADFTDGSQTLTETNTSGDAQLNSYSWSVEGGVLKFIWETSASSGNPTPPTSTKYDKTKDEITVTFTELNRDSVLGSDGELDAELSGIVESVSGRTSGSGSTYVFTLASDTTYRIYRNSSPNQVVLEISL